METTCFNHDGNVYWLNDHSELVVAKHGDLDNWEYVADEKIINDVMKVNIFLAMYNLLLACKYGK